MNDQTGVTELMYAIRMRDAEAIYGDRAVDNALRAGVHPLALLDELSKPTPPPDPNRHERRKRAALQRGR